MAASLLVLGGGFGRDWHEADVPRCLLCGRYQGISGRNADIGNPSKMTRLRHRVFLAFGTTPCFACRTNKLR